MLSITVHDGDPMCETTFTSVTRPPCILLWCSTAGDEGAIVSVRPHCLSSLQYCRLSGGTILLEQIYINYVMIVALA